ncbi:hypothetical protein Tco_0743084 [Tanacetum coccineum]
MHLEQNHPKVKTKYKENADKSCPFPPRKRQEPSCYLKVLDTNLQQSSHASGSGDGVDTQSKVPNEQQQKDSGTDKGVGDKLEVLDVPKYDSESDEESWTFSQDEEDADEETDVNDDSDETESDNDGDDLTHPNLSTYKEDDEEEEQEKADDEEMFSDQRVSTPHEDELFEEEEENK